MNINYNNSVFPSQVVSDAEKSSIEYGRKVARAIESYIETYVGLRNDNTYGDVYFQRTLEDWAKFDINNRTTHDASISSGLAIMACNKNKYRPVPKIIRQNYDLGIKKYDNSGLLSKIID